MAAPLSMINKLMQLREGQKQSICNLNFIHEENTGEYTLACRKWRAIVSFNYYDQEGVYRRYETDSYGSTKASSKLASATEGYEYLYPGDGTECIAMTISRGKNRDAARAAGDAFDRVIFGARADVAQYSPVNVDRIMEKDRMKQQKKFWDTTSNWVAAHHAAPPPELLASLLAKVVDTPPRTYLPLDHPEIKKTSGKSSSPSSSVDSGVFLREVTSLVPKTATSSSSIYFALDMEATTQSYEDATEVEYPAGTVTQIGIVILYATEESALEYLAQVKRHKKLDRNVKTYHFTISELVDYKTDIQSLQNGGDFIFGESEMLSYADINSKLTSILEEESQYGQVTLVGHAIPSEIQFLEQNEITALEGLYAGALDIQPMLRDNSTHLLRLQVLVGKFGGEIAGWHNAGNDAVWTLWVLMKLYEKGKPEGVRELELMEWEVISEDESNGFLPLTSEILPVDAQQKQLDEEAPKVE